MNEQIDYKLKYLEERINSFQHELAFLQSRFPQVQERLNVAIRELNEYSQSVKAIPEKQE